MNPAHPVSFCWTVPRTVSTSFERMVIERGDHVVFDEPYSRSYYFGPDRRSPRYAGRGVEDGAAAVTDEIRAASERSPVFAKDMAYHAIDLVEPDVLAGFRHCFLIRHPAAAIRSLAGEWPDFTDAEAGWAALDRMADLAEASGSPLVVVESEELCAAPEAVVAAWCDAMGWPFDPAALTWEAGMRDEWSLWPEWHESSARSTGFRPLPDERRLPDGSPDRLHAVLAAALPVYERLRRHSVTR